MNLPINDGFSILYANDNPLSSLLLLVGTKYANSILLPSVVSESTHKSAYVLSLGKKVNAIGSSEINFFVLEFLWRSTKEFIQVNDEYWSILKEYFCVLDSLFKSIINISFIIV